MQPTQIKCPNCNSTFPLDKALSHELEESIKKKQEEALEQQKKELNEKAKLWQKEKEEEIERKAKEEKERFSKETEEYKKKLQDAQDRELQLLKKQEEIEERERNLELETKRQIALEKAKIQEEEQKRAREDFQLELAAKDKKLADAIKANEELKMKLTQGSQQLQGEVLELELEQLLKTEFPLDQIEPVGKGVNGADVIQNVCDQTGRNCGIIIWESKRTKRWDEGWVQKLKDDQRGVKADVAVLVSTILPEKVKGFGPYDKIYVTNFENLIGVTKLLRAKIIELCYAKMSTEGKSEKKEVLWNYLTGNEFKQRVEAIVEAFNLMKLGLDKEKLYFTKKWSQQEKLIDTVINQTVGMHGDLQGLMGASLPEIKSLEMENFELLETTQISITDDTATVLQSTTVEAVIES